MTMSALKSIATLAANLALLCAFVLQAHGLEKTDCSGIINDKARLACYDLAAPPVKEASRSPSPAMDQQRLIYRTQLERAFLKSGISAELFMPDAASDPSNFKGKYPKLIVWTYLSRAAVFQLITEAKVLDGAREVGFKMVDFTDKGHEGHWIYDLTEDSNCDVKKRLCY